MKKRREYDDDDGRTIANMNVDGMPWYVPKQKNSESSDSEPVYLSGKEKLSMYFGVLKAVALVSGVFILGYLLVILLLTRIW